MAETGKMALVLKVNDKQFIQVFTEVPNDIGPVKIYQAFVQLSEALEENLVTFLIEGKFAEKEEDDSDETTG